MFLTSRLRSFGVFRPTDARILSWEGMLFLFARWPWSLLGVVTAVIDFLRDSEAGFRVTPKGVSKARTLPFSVLLPYIVLVLASVLPVIFLDSSAYGYYIFSLFNCTIYAALLATITARHWMENGCTWSHNASPLINTAKTAVVLFMVAIPCAGLFRVPEGIASLIWIEKDPRLANLASRLSGLASANAFPSAIDPTLNNTHDSD